MPSHYTYFLYCITSISTWPPTSALLLVQTLLNRVLDILALIYPWYACWQQSACLEIASVDVPRPAVPIQDSIHLSISMRHLHWAAILRHPNRNNT
ncbi:MAG: hypothetical protein NXY57DRAFT_694325 [Lentinula lateritia]|uniref:Uncharacterized protein n=1 Tax=Lentinula lateritia TaxID=40482 RepID=A0ABQ8VQI0_9AGAR|nr:MAG: hypothetical protein NXY57DRAFT_694325 [Lentinula lateritia]KAJ4498653.1 hypothetical protein C8R41DRAFT_120498 [Lentinula lateritia]